MKASVFPVCVTSHRRLHGGVTKYAVAAQTAAPLWPIKSHRPSSSAACEHIDLDLGNSGVTADVWGAG